jgi:hypothetical protein
MNFRQFQSSIYAAVTGGDVSRHRMYRGHNITETVDHRVYIDCNRTQFRCLEEAIDNIEQQNTQQDVQREIQQQLYEQLSYNQIANIIKKYHNDVKITDTLIESYIELASSKLFTTDPVAQQIRNLNALDRLIEGHVDYKLNDGTVVVITDSVQQRINNVFGQHQDVVEYMRESKQNFLNVLNLLEE